MGQSHAGQFEQLIRLDCQRDADGHTRWRKQLSPQHPAAAYWLSHEARMMQTLDWLQLPAARLLNLDLEQLSWQAQAEGYPLSQWLQSPTAELDHPFQHSSDLIRLILSCLRLLQKLQAAGIAHGNLRPDNLLLNTDANGQINYDSLTLLELSTAHSASEPLRKLPVLDPHSPHAAYFSPTMRAALQNDWLQLTRRLGQAASDEWRDFSQ